MMGQDGTLLGEGGGGVCLQAPDSRPPVIRLMPANQLACPQVHSLIGCHTNIRGPCHSTFPAIKEMVTEWQMAPERQPKEGYSTERPIGRAHCRRLSVGGGVPLYRPVTRRNDTVDQKDDIS